MPDIEVRPLDISVEPLGIYIHAFSGFFGKFEMDVTALVIVEYCQRDNVWHNFTPAELLEQTKSNNPGNASNYIVSGIGSLVDYGWIIPCGDGSYTVTTEFKERCKLLSANVGRKK